MATSLNFRYQLCVRNNDLYDWLIDEVTLSVIERW